MAAPCSASSPKPCGAARRPVDDLNRVPLGFNCYLIRTGDHTVLIETGGGDKLDARFRERAKLPPVRRSPARHHRAPRHRPRIHRYRDQQPPALGPLQRQHRAHSRTAPSPPSLAHATSPRAPSGRTPTSITSATRRLHRRELRSADGVRPSHPGRRWRGDRARHPHAQRSRPQSRHDGGHRRKPRPDLLLPLRPGADAPRTCSPPGFRPSISIPWNPSIPASHWLTRAVEGNWLCGFGHDPDIAFAHIVNDPKSIDSHSDPESRYNSPLTRQPESAGDASNERSHKTTGAQPLTSSRSARTCVCLPCPRQFSWLSAQSDLPLPQQDTSHWLQSLLKIPIPKFATFVPSMPTASFRIARSRRSTPLWDPRPPSFEASADTMAVVDTSGLTEATAGALARLEQLVASIGGRLELKSAYRPSAYQEHLQEIWDKMRALRRNRQTGCQALRAEISAEFSRHRLLVTQRPVTDSDHTRGVGIDAALVLPPRSALQSPPHQPGSPGPNGRLQAPRHPSRPGPLPLAGASRRRTAPLTPRRRVWTYAVRSRFRNPRPTPTGAFSSTPRHLRMICATCLCTCKFSSRNRRSAYDSASSSGVSVIVPYIG